MFSSKLLLLLFLVSIFENVISQNNGFGFFEKVYELDKSLTPKEREQVREIGNNSTATKHEIIDNLRTFFHGIGGDPEEKFNSLAEMYRNKISEMSKKIKETQLSMDDEKSKEIFENAAKIHQNMNITFAEEKKQIKDILKNATPEVKRKIEHIFWHSSKNHKTSNN